MNDITPEQIKERFDTLSQELQAAISSVDILEKVRAIGKKRDLMIDETAELVDQVAMVMLGFAKSTNFVGDIANRLSISAPEAQNIGVDVNREIFDGIKNYLRKNEEMPARPIAESRSSLEKVGNFTIEKEVVTDESSTAKVDMPSGDRVNLLSSKPDANPYHEPLVDQLLRGSTAIPQEKTVIRPTSSVPQPPSNLPTGDGSNDPYRETVK